jgi:uncharacterized protein (DUF2267 family)
MNSQERQDEDEVVHNQDDWNNSPNTSPISKKKIKVRSSRKKSKKNNKKMNDANEVAAAVKRVFD